MKKLLVLIMVLVLTMSFFGCGNSSKVQEGVPTTSNEAVPVNFEEMIKVFRDNKINGEDTYYNHYYTITGTVRRINDDSVDIQPIDIAVAGSTASLCHVMLSRDELKTLSTFDVITVSGKMTEYDESFGACSLTLEDGHYIDNNIKVIGKVSNYHVFTNDTNTVFAEIKVMVITGDYTTTNYFDVKIPDCDPFVGDDEEVKINSVTLKQGDTVTINGSIKMNADYGTNRFLVTELNSIEK